MKQPKKLLTYLISFAEHSWQNCLFTPFRPNKICLRVVDWINDRDIFRIKNAVNQALQCTKKNPLIDWLIRNWWQLRQQANSNLYSNQGPRISQTNGLINNQVDEQTNELSEDSTGRKRLICDLELVCGTFLIDVKEAILLKQCLAMKILSSTVCIIFHSKPFSGS